MVTKGDLLYEGKAKKIFSVINDDHHVIQSFKDSLTAFNGEKKAETLGKGALNYKISVLLYKYLETQGYKTHFKSEIDETSMLVERLEIVPLEVVVRNKTAGSLVKRYGLKEGVVIEPSLVEFYLKDDELGDPLLSESHALLLNIADEKTIESLKSQALHVNDLLRPVFRDAGLDLVDFKLEFGKNKEGSLLLGDEISPDTCRIWDLSSGEKLDKDRFRFNLGSVRDGYEKVYELLNAKLGGQP